jgi:sensor c-di-GMP phosphodiesterase-like protein
MEMGCDQGQGYHYSRAIPAEEFERWLEDRPTPARATVTAIPRDPTRSAAAA